MSEWYYAVNDQKLGPVSDDTINGLLREGRVKGTDLVWREGMPAWAPAQSVAELNGAHSTVPPAATVPEWHYAVGEQKVGPVSEADLRSLAQAGRLRGSDLVWKEGMQGWVPASTIPGILPVASTLGTPASANQIHASNPPKSEWLCLLNLPLPGLAQIIHGQVSKGLVMIVIDILLYFILNSSYSMRDIKELILLVFSIFCVLDAYRLGLALKAGRAVGATQLFVGFTSWSEPKP